MRTDCTIDARQTKCPHLVPTQGFNKWKAQVGDCLLYSSGNRYRMARYLGRVYDFRDREGNMVRKPLALVMALSDDGTHAYERWINPQDICQIFETPSALAAFFFAPKLPYPVPMLRRLMEYGSTCNRYVANAAEHVARWSKGG